MISLISQQEVYLVQDDEGVMLYRKKYSKVFINSSIPKKWLQQTLETESN